jgi:hypothetical protein
MPVPNQARIARLIERLLEVLDAADLDDNDADAVLDILLPKLWERSGPDRTTFYAAVDAALSNSDRTIRRH